ncbi:MAG: hypothetical protein HOM58_02020 [Rhodospirillaceae bacterium]|nr:hypothetical protein [Rhodospirillaceae bacterium]MBT5457900.1 hypothetical protein [Rhodospirillaceae bacterium]
MKVRLNPEVAFAMGGHSYLMHIWATNNPTLTEETLSMGLYFFRHYYRKVGGNDVQFLIFDTVKDRIFAEFNVLDSANDMLIEQRAILSSMWSEISSGTGAPSTPPTTSEYQEDQPHV